MSKKPTPNPAPAPAPAARPQSGGPHTLLMASVVLVLIAIGAIVWLIASGQGNAPAAPANNAAEAVPLPEPGPGPAPGPQAAPAGVAPTPGGGQLLPSGLRLETVREGRGPLVTPADTVHFRYELRTFGGPVLESNMNAPRAAAMPVSGLVPGFAEGLTHMRAGGEARFWVPPHLGYGSSPPPGGGIGPNDTLEFRVRVERIVPAGANSSNPANAATEAPAPAPGQ